MRRRRATLWPLLVACLVTGLRAEQEEAPVVEREEGSDAAVTAIATDLRVEQTLLEESVSRYRELGGRREGLLARLSELYGELDRRIASATGEQGTARIALLLDQIDAAEIERDRLATGGRHLVEQILVQSRRVALLVEQLALLEGQMQEREAGSLTGEWAVSMLPLAHKGTFDLRQSGTLVSGTYRLDGGWTGSVQGTLVNRKIYLVRIDSKLGKSMELEGYLSADGTTIRGSWLNYELAGAAGSTGQWTATKK